MDLHLIYALPCRPPAKYLQVSVESRSGVVKPRRSGQPNVGAKWLGNKDGFKMHKWSFGLAALFIPVSSRSYRALPHGASQVLQNGEQQYAQCLQLSEGSPTRYGGISHATVPLFSFATTSRAPMAGWNGSDWYYSQDYGFWASNKDNQNHKLSFQRWWVLGYK